MNQVAPLLDPAGIEQLKEALRSSDGTVALRDQLAVLAVAHDADEGALADVAGPIVAHLVERGIIVPTEGT